MDEANDELGRTAGPDSNQAKYPVQVKGLLAETYSRGHPTQKPAPDIVK